MKGAASIATASYTAPRKFWKSDSRAEGSALNTRRIEGKNEEMAYASKGKDIFDSTE